MNRRTVHQCMPPVSCSHPMDGPRPTHAHAAAREIAAWQEYRVRDALGRTFRSKATRVVIRKPRLMPWRLFYALMRCVVIEEREGRAPTVPRTERRSAKRGLR